MRRGSWPSRSPAFPISRVSPTTPKHNHKGRLATGHQVDLIEMEADHPKSPAAQIPINLPPRALAISPLPHDTQLPKTRPYFIAPGTSCGRKRMRTSGIGKPQICTLFKGPVAYSKRAASKKAPSQKTKEAMRRWTRVTSKEKVIPSWTVHITGASKVVGMGPGAVLCGGRLTMQVDGVVTNT